MPIKINLDQGNRDVLDLSKSLVRSREELDKVLEKVPDFRTRPEKVRPEDLQIPGPNNNFSFTVTKTELQVLQLKEFPDPFPNPILPPMDSVELDDMRAVDIDWRMLTTCRPINKLDEDIFSRVIALERHAFKSSERESEHHRKGRHNSNRRGPPEKRSNVIRRSSVTTVNAGSAKMGSRSVGVFNAEIRHQTCRECGEEFCTGSCKDHQYEIHERLPPVEEDDDAAQPQLLSLGDGDKENKGKKKKVGKKGGKPKEKDEPEEPKKKGNSKDTKTAEKKNSISSIKDSGVKRASPKSDKLKKVEKNKSAPHKDAKSAKKDKETKSEKKSASPSPTGLIAPDVKAAKLRKRSPRPRKNIARARTPTRAATIETDLAGDTAPSSLLKPPGDDTSVMTPTSPRSAASPRPKKNKKPKQSDSQTVSAKTSGVAKAKSPKPSGNKQSRNAAEANPAAATTSKKSPPKKHDRNKSPETMVRRIKM